MTQYPVHTPPWGQHRSDLARIRERQVAPMHPRAYAEVPVLQRGRDGPLPVSGAAVRAFVTHPVLNSDLRAVGPSLDWLHRNSDCRAGHGSMHLPCLADALVKSMPRLAKCPVCECVINARPIRWEGSTVQPHVVDTSTHPFVSAWWLNRDWGRAFCTNGVDPTLLVPVAANVPFVLETIWHDLVCSTRR